MITLLEHVKMPAAWIALAVGCVTVLLTDAETLAASPTSESPAPSPGDSDPYLWLENVTDEQALTWVRQQNAVSTNELESASEFEPTRRRLLSIMDSKERIPYVAKHGKWY